MNLSKVDDKNLELLLAELKGRQAELATSSDSWERQQTALAGELESYTESMSGLSPFITDFPAPLEARDASSLESVALISKISFLIFSLSSFAFDLKDFSIKFPLQSFFYLQQQWEHFTPYATL